MLAAIARLALTAPRRVLAMALLVVAAAGIFGVPVAGSLSAGGFQDPRAESSEATRLLSEDFGQGDMDLLFTVSSPDDVTAPPARDVGTGIVAALQSSPHVAQVASPWTAPAPVAGQLVSRDGRTALIVAGINGNETEAQRYAEELIDEVVVDRGDITVRAGGEVTTYLQVNSQTEHDLLVMESIAVPLSFLVLVWVFGGLFAAALPMLVGVSAILGSMAVLRLIATVTDVSVFALNLSIAMGLALAIDYTLLLVSRYRDEVADGADRARALLTTMATAGRTVCFSALTVALSMVSMVLFPMYFLKSFAYAGVAVVTFAAVAALLVAPAALVLLGDRVDALDVRSWLRRRLRRPEKAPVPVHQAFWYRTTSAVMRHPIAVGGTVVGLLLALGLPFIGVTWGTPDDRVLPTTASAYQVGEQLRTEFAADSATEVTVVVPEAGEVGDQALSQYAAELSRLTDVTAVSAPTGAFVNGRLAGAPASATGVAGDSVFLTVDSSAPLFSDASDEQLRSIRATAGPAGEAVLVTGNAAFNRDSVDAITSRLPVVLGAIAVVTLMLLFLLTGSVVLPLKALLLNVLSLTAAFGALVWIFQEGHLGAFGTTTTGTLSVTMPVLLFCIAFGLAMDYEVFLLSRIREYWLASNRTSADNDESVALGLARTGRVITAAALIMSISFAALTAAQVSFMRMFGVGMTVAVLVDATLVRVLLVPAFMRLLGRFNWWAPAPLARLHERIGISESGPAATGRSPARALADNG